MEALQSCRMQILDTRRGRRHFVRKIAQVQENSSPTLTCLNGVLLSNFSRKTVKLSNTLLLITETLSYLRKSSANWTTA